jgi:hypothetical protein
MSAARNRWPAAAARNRRAPQFRAPSSAPLPSPPAPHLQAARLRRLAALAAPAAAEAPAAAAHAAAAHGERVRRREVGPRVVTAGRIVPVPRGGVEVARCRARVAWPAPAAAAAAERAAAATGGRARDGCAAAPRRAARRALEWVGAGAESGPSRAPLRGRGGAAAAARARLGPQIPGEMADLAPRARACRAAPPPRRRRRRGCGGRGRGGGAAAAGRGRRAPTGPSPPPPPPRRGCGARARSSGPARPASARRRPPRTSGAAPDGPVTLMAFVRPSGPSSTSYSTSSPSRRLRKPSTWMLVCGRGAGSRRAGADVRRTRPWEPLGAARRGAGPGGPAAIGQPCGRHGDRRARARSPRGRHRDARGPHLVDEKILLGLPRVVARGGDEAEALGGPRDAHMKGLGRCHRIRRPRLGGRPPGAQIDTLRGRPSPRRPLGPPHLRRIEPFDDALPFAGRGSRRGRLLRGLLRRRLRGFSHAELGAPAAPPGEAEDGGAGLGLGATARGVRRHGAAG